MSNKTLLSITSLPIFLPTEPQNLTQIMEYILPNRVTLPSQIRDFKTESSTIRCQDRGNYEDVKDIDKSDSTKGNIREIWTAEVGIGDYFIRGQESAPLRLAIKIARRDRAIIGEVDFVTQIQASQVKNKKERTNRMDFELEKVSKNDDNSEESDEGSQQDFGGKDEGQDDIDCQELQDLKEVDKTKMQRFERANQEREEENETKKGKKMR